MGDKVIRLKEERKLSGEFLIIQRSQPELVPKLEETSGNYEMSIVPCSLCAMDDSLSILADKASLIHIAKEVKAHADPSKTNLDIQSTYCWCHGSASEYDESTIHEEVSHLEEAFIKHIKSLMVDYDDTHLVFINM